MFLLKQTFALSTLLSRIIFTFHNVSIKTCPAALYITTLSPLHSTMFLLKRKVKNIFFNSSIPLHSTMFLLKLCCADRTGDVLYFTFHNVSIKTLTAPSAVLFAAPLHSTMFLLKPVCQLRICGFESGFTFHNVSIKTKIVPTAQYGIPTLHSTMFLLKPFPAVPALSPCSAFTFHNVSIKTQRLFPGLPLRCLYIPQCFY